MSHTIELTRHQAGRKMADLTIEEIIARAMEMALESDEKTSTCLRTLIEMIRLEMKESIPGINRNG